MEEGAHKGKNAHSISRNYESHNAPPSNDNWFCLGSWIYNRYSWNIFMYTLPKTLFFSFFSCFCWSLRGLIHFIVFVHHLHVTSTWTASLGVKAPLGWTSPFWQRCPPRATVKDSLHPPTNCVCCLCLLFTHFHSFHSSGEYCVPGTVTLDIPSLPVPAKFSFQSLGHVPIHVAPGPSIITGLFPLHPQGTCRQCPRI